MLLTCPELYRRVNGCAYPTRVIQLTCVYKIDSRPVRFRSISSFAVFRPSSYFVLYPLQHPSENSFIQNTKYPNISVNAGYTRFSAALNHPMKVK